MLSGETAIGDHPREAVEMMNQVALATEEMYPRPAAATSPATCSATRLAAGHQGRRLGSRADRPEMKAQAGRRGQPQRRHGAGAFQAAVLHAGRRRERLRRHAAADDACYWGVIPLATAPDGQQRRAIGLRGQLGTRATARSTRATTSCWWPASAWAPVRTTWSACTRWRRDSGRAVMSIGVMRRLE